jgi:hypothetical protein
MNNNQKELEKIAIKVLKDSGLYEEGNFGNPIAILMVISIILTCVRVIQECNKNKVSTYSDLDKLSFYRDNINSLSIRRNWFTKMRIKKIIRQNMNPADYKAYANKLLGGILQYGEKLTDEETSTLMEASNV